MGKLSDILAKLSSDPSTATKQDALSGLVGEVQESPTSNTVLARLKDLVTSLEKHSETDVVTSGQLAMTGSAVRPSDASKVYKKLYLMPDPNNGAAIYIGPSGVSAGTGLYVSELVPTVLYNVDIATVYAIGTASDVLTWAGTE
jgi:hypothetical protein